MNLTTTSARESLWLDEPGGPRFASLDGSLEVDVAVLGGGIAGLMTALLLHREGARVAVLEAERIGAGVTGCTTAKVSALQSTIYSTIRSRHGDEVAAVYADASLSGVESVAQLAVEEGIECDLQRRPACTYAASLSERSQVEQEAEVAARAGLPVEFVEKVDLPVAVHGAAVLSDQIQLHPVRFVRGLARTLASNGSSVFERTRALSVHEGSPCRVETDGGAVTAEHVVVATHYPVFDRGLYFARLEAQRSYCVAGRVA
ncbi:MAG: FAD-dependent oxidoreductase, partial [Solirubrobacterales bacterium]|nr:FAD-dependent oxidoreductase [Solirubrobacterales bacterium]